MSFIRRQFLRLLAVPLIARASGGMAATPQMPGNAEAADRSPLLSMADMPAAELDSTDKIERRFGLYKSLGCGGLRTGLGWRNYEKREGVWNAEAAHLKNYYEAAKRGGFRVKCMFGALSSVPGWFFEKYPDARIINERGDTMPGYMSPWYPQGPAILAEKLSRVFAIAREAGALDIMDYAIVDLGPGGGEPTYPAAWHVGHGYTIGSTTFWYFDPWAQKDFTVKMQAKYAGDLAKANTHWGTNYRSWSDVKPPQTAAITGPIWHDTLDWYFEAKRRMLAAQIGSMVGLIKALGPAHVIRPMLLMPGDRATHEDRDLTAQTGIGTYLVKIASEPEFIVDEAVKNGCWLQYG